jgi:hypothetical protein
MKFARIAEIVLGLWLMVTPAVLAGAVEVPGGAVGLGAVVTAIAACAMVPAFERFYPHLANGLIGLWLCGWIFVADRPVAPAGQSALIVGLLLLMFAVIPARAASPPRRWRDYLSKKLD